MVQRAAALLAFFFLTCSAFAAPQYAQQLPFNTGPSLGRSSSNPNAKPLLSPAFDVFVESLLKEWGVPGLAMGVIKVRPDMTPLIEFHSFGTMGRNLNVTEDTLFGIASNSKAFTTASLGVLHDRGRLNWTQKVADLLPEFQLLDPVANQYANLRDILSHRTGLPRHDSAYQMDEEHSELVHRIRYLRPSAEFRETWQYNNQMFITGALLTSRLSGTLFSSFVTKFLLEPLNMSSSTYFPSLTPDSQLSDSFLTVKNGSVVEIPYGFANFTPGGVETSAGAGGVVSSAKDMVKWLEFLITQANATEGSSTRFDSILSSSVIKEMIRLHMPAMRTSPYTESSPQGYGMGLGITHYQGIQMVRHGGSLPGFGSQVVWSPAEGVGIAALCNTMETGNAVSDIASYRAFEDLLSLPHIDWNSRYAKNMNASRLKSELAVARAQERAPATASGNFSELVGTYHDPGYGNFTVCPPTPPCSHECAAFLSRLKSAEPITPIPASALFVTAPGFFSQTHAALLEPAPGSYDFQGVPAEIYGVTTTRLTELLGYQWESEVKARFVKRERGWEMEVWGIWGAGPEAEESKEPEVVFVKLANNKWQLE